MAGGAPMLCEIGARRIGNDLVGKRFLVDGAFDGVAVAIAAEVPRDA